MNANSGVVMRCTVTVLTGLFGTLVAPCLVAQATSDASALRSKIRAYSSAHDVEIVRQLTELLAIPNLASDSANIRRNAGSLVELLSKRGVDARLLESP